MFKITKEEIQLSVNWLMEQKEGCSYYKTGNYDKENNPLCVVFGWEGGYETDSEDLYADGEYRICCKIAFNNSALQCDYEWDFVMPYDEDTSEVCDTDMYVGEDFDSLADYLNKQVETISKAWCV